jgi:PDDEXK-like domain of unknown function (DUF3799)
LVKENDMPNRERPVIEPGIYVGLDEDIYHAADGLSFSGMKALSISPLNYWHHNLNPDYEREKEGFALRFGKAAHCLALEPDWFNRRYALQLTPKDRPGALVSADDMKAFLEKNGLPKSAKRKQDLIDRIKGSGLEVPIWDHEIEEYAQLHAGKTLLGEDESARLGKAASILRDDQAARAILTGGIPEVSFFVRDPETGVMLKARMDYVKPKATIDLKTFSNSRGKPTDKVVFDAIYYERYHLQCVFYTKVRELTRKLLEAGEIAVHGDFSEEWLKGFTCNKEHGFGFVFLESSEPFDLRVVQMRVSERAGGDMNVYWLSAMMAMDDLTALYTECKAKYGDGPWRDTVTLHVLADSDIPQLAFS